MNTYIPADKLIAEIESRMGDCKLPDGKFPATANIVRYEELSCLRDFIISLQQEQPTRGYDEAYLNECIAKARKTWKGVDVDKYMDEMRGREQEQPELPGIEEPGIPGKDFIPVEWVDACEMYGKWKIVKQEQPEVELEKAAQHVYESWMGGTMDDVLRDMVELGKVLNARKK